MNNEIKLVSGAMVMLALSTSALVVLPYLQVHDAEPLPGLQPYTSAELRGREVYIANGCVYTSHDLSPYRMFSQRGRIAAHLRLSAKVCANAEAWLIELRRFLVGEGHEGGLHRALRRA